LDVIFPIRTSKFLKIEKEKKFVEKDLVKCMIKSCGNNVQGLTNLNRDYNEDKKFCKVGWYNKDRNRPGYYLYS
jgi:hypothetical protein